MRLIDAETLKVSITRYCAKHAEHQKWRRLKDHTSELCRDICFAIDAMPTEVEERKTGKWIDETFKPWGLVYHPYKCDQCGECSEADSYFCPNCGAKMEEKTDDRLQELPLRKVGL